MQDCIRNSHPYTVYSHKVVNTYPKSFPMISFYVISKDKKPFLLSWVVNSNFIYSLFKYVPYSKHKYIKCNSDLYSVCKDSTKNDESVKL